MTKTLREVLELSEPNVLRRHNAGITNYAHGITRDGENVGQTTLTRHDDEPDHLHVGHVSSRASRLNDFGHSETRSLLRAVKRAHPWAKTIGGYRVTGARYDSGAVFDKSRVKQKPAGEENMRMRLPEDLTLDPPHHVTPNGVNIHRIRNGDDVVGKTGIRPQGNHLHVDHVLSSRHREGTGGVGSMGHGQTRSLLRAVKRHYPEAKTIGGWRMTGARERAGATDKLDHRHENARVRLPESFNSFLAESKPFTDRRAHDTFMYGHCRSFACALHRRVGGEVRALHKDGREHHVYVHRDGHNYDHKGRRGHASMIMDTDGSLENGHRWSDHPVDAAKMKTKEAMVRHAERYIDANRHKFR